MSPFRFSSAVLLIALVLRAVGVGACEDPRPLRFAQVPIKNPEVLALQYRPLFRHLENTLGRRIEIVRAPSYAAVVEGLISGSVDLAELGPAAYALAQQRKASIVPFAAKMESGSELVDSSNGYRAVLIVRSDRGIGSLGALRGSAISLVDPGSTSGSLYPRKMIAGFAGVPLESYFRQVSYAGSHDRAIEAVRSRLVDGAFVSSLRVNEMVRRGALSRDELKVLWQSAPIPFDPFVYRRALCPVLVERIRAAFLSGDDALKPFFEALGQSAFKPVSADDYREVVEIYSNLRP